MGATDVKRRRMSPHVSQQRRAVNRAGGPFARWSTRAYFMRGQVGRDQEEELDADLLQL